MRILHLTIKKKWFDMIVSGIKKEDYRELKPHWHSRLNCRTYDAVKFRNGYNTDSPTYTCQCLGIEQGLGLTHWGAPFSKIVYRIMLGPEIKEPKP